MTANIIDGNKLAGGVYREIEEEVGRLKERGIFPGLVVVLVGENPASVSYVRSKTRACERVGIYGETIKLPVDVSEDELLRIIGDLNHDTRFHGILVQLPLPRHISPDKVMEAIFPEKDVDAFHPVNMGKLLNGNPYLLPCTAQGVQQLVIRSGYSFDGKHVVICGRSNVVGKPLAAMLVQKANGANATVTVCHTHTKDLAVITRQADILVAAMGSPGAITADMVKEGVIVVDVGINRVPDAAAPRGYRLVGDVDFAAVQGKAEAITPVPGGMGPMTVAMLLHNTIIIAQKELPGR